MIWLFLFMLWSITVVFYGPATGRPAAKMLVYLVALLGFLHVLVTVIEILQSFGF